MKKTISAIAIITFLNLPGTATAGNQPLNEILHEICKNSINQIPREPSVEILFDQTVPVKDLRRFVRLNHFDVWSTSLNTPTPVKIVWRDYFLQKKPVTTEELNDFFSLLQNTPSILSSGVQRSFQLSKGKITNPDRYGYFILSFSDAKEKKQFLKEHRKKLTLFWDGDITQTLRFSTGKSEKIATVLYRAKPEMRILRRIKNKIKRKTDFFAVKEITVGYLKEIYPVVSSNFSSGTITGVKDAESKTSFIINFPSTYDATKIKKILSPFRKKIDLEKTSLIIREQDFIGISVPAGQEECWAHELQKHPYVKEAIPEEVTEEED